jgi:Mn2+/Fe2+ NRAMP family transporter
VGLRSRLLTDTGPAILLTATSVGAGDILTGSLAGSEAGIAVIWAVPVGVALKWTLNEGIARWQMATGATLLEGWMTRLRWIQWPFLAYLLLFTLVVGGMLSSACGVAGAAVFPFGDLDRSRFVWGAIHSLAGLVLVWFGGYELLKRVLALCVGAMFFLVTMTAFLLAPDWMLVARGLAPSLPASGAGWVAALIGAVGGTVALISYGYWIREEGRSGEPGLRACRFDLLLSYAVIGLFGMAVVIIGSRVSVTGQGAGLAVLLAEQLGASLGPAGKWIFLAGFWAAVFSALLGVWQSIPYLFTDFIWLRQGRGIAQRGEIDVGRSAPYRACLFVMATIPLALLCWPVQKLQLAFGLTGAMLLPLLAATLLIMNNRRDWVGERFRSSLALNLVLAAALILFGWLGWGEMAEAVRKWK